MKVTRLRCVVPVTALALIALACASAETIPVFNANFATLPAGEQQLPYSCGGTCLYGLGPIPGWGPQDVSPGDPAGLFGQLQPGNELANYFMSLPGGTSTIAYTDGTTLYQWAGYITPGYTYTLSVDVGWAYGTSFESNAQLCVWNGSTCDFITATGTQPDLGGWSLYTASFMAPGSEAGDSMTIELCSEDGESQADFANVSLTASTPEGSTFGLVLLGGCVCFGAMFHKERSAERRTA